MTKAALAQIAHHPVTVTVLSLSPDSAAAAMPALASTAAVIQAAGVATFPKKLRRKQLSVRCPA